MPRLDSPSALLEPVAPPSQGPRGPSQSGWGGVRPSAGSQTSASENGRGWCRRADCDALSRAGRLRQAPCFALRAGKQRRLSVPSPSRQTDSGLQAAVGHLGRQPGLPSAFPFTAGAEVHRTRLQGDRRGWAHPSGICWGCLSGRTPSLDQGRLARTLGRRRPCSQGCWARWLCSRNCR